MQLPDDTELLKRINAGEARAFTTLYEKHSRPLFRYCFRLLQHRETAEDTVQTAFIKAFASLARLQDPASFRCWLYAIARNEVYGSLRLRRRNGVQTALDDACSVWDENSPYAQLVQQEASEVVETVLSELKAEYREVIILRQFDGLSYGEIASITGDSASSVASRLFKARKALEKRLSPYFRPTH
jgi:RNA polymerase sigma-70 factor (ECF subfamily)